MEESEIRNELCSILSEIKAVRASISILTSIMMHDKSIDARGRVIEGQQIIEDEKGPWLDEL